MLWIHGFTHLRSNPSLPAAAQQVPRAAAALTLTGLSAPIRILGLTHLGACAAVRMLWFCTPSTGGVKLGTVPAVHVLAGIIRRAVRVAGRPHAPFPGRAVENCAPAGVGQTIARQKALLGRVERRTGDSIVAPIRKQFPLALFQPSGSYSMARMGRCGSKTSQAFWAQSSKVYGLLDRQYAPKYEFGAPSDLPSNPARRGGFEGRVELGYMASADDVLNEGCDRDRPARIKHAAAERSGSGRQRKRRRRRRRRRRAAAQSVVTRDASTRVMEKGRRHSRENFTTKRGRTSARYNALIFRIL